MSTIQQLLIRSLCIGLLAGMPLLSSATTVSSDVVGYVKINCLGGSDTTFGLPLNRVASKSLTISGVNIPQNYLLLSANELVKDQFKDSHYARINNSSLKGSKFTITSNTINEIYLDNIYNYDLSKITVGSAIDVIPHMTVTDLFSSVSDIPNFTKLLYYDSTTTGINKSSAGGYTYYDGNWYDSVSGELANNAVIYPDESITIRVPGDHANDFELTISGHVPNVAHNFTLICSSHEQNDNYISTSLPVKAKLIDLFPHADDYDKVIMADNTNRALNKSASQSYVFYNSDWYDSSNGNLANESLVEPWTISFFRKSASNTNTFITYIGELDYLNQL